MAACSERQAQAAAAAIIARGRQMALERLEPAAPETEPMKRYPHPIPCAADCPSAADAGAMDRILEELACQNQLLLDLLSAVNGLTAAVLGIQGRCSPGDLT